MNIEKERAEFEAWCRSVSLPTDKDACGDYIYVGTHAPWLAWQARAALQSQEREDAERLKDKEDAERYRRLRKGDIDDVAVVQGLGAMDYGASAVIGTYSVEINGDDLDAAIDHARRIEGEA